MYGVSKLCEATYTRILARQLQGRHIHVNACCPGYCATEMSSWRGQKTAVGASEHAAQVHLHARVTRHAVVCLTWRAIAPRLQAQGADTPVWLALRPPAESQTGGFYSERRLEDF